jgi:hypothetical protein
MSDIVIKAWCRKQGTKTLASWEVIPNKEFELNEPWIERTLHFATRDAESQLRNLFKPPVLLTLDFSLVTPPPTLLIA